MRFDNPHSANNIIGSGGFTILKIEEPKYKLYVAPNFCMSQHKRPNWFHRVMQRIFFGFKWENTNEKND